MRVNFKFNFEIELLYDLLGVALSRIFSQGNRAKVREIAFESRLKIECDSFKKIALGFRDRLTF